MKIGKTKEQLILTAMALYAEHGIDAVSLRTISAKSGTRNSAAAHYHFQNKLGLIDGIVTYVAGHLRVLGADREVFLQEAAQSPKPVADILRATFVGPYQLRQALPWGAAANKFMSRLLIEVDQDIRDTINRNFGKHYEVALAAIKLVLPDIPDDILRLRMMLMAENVAHAAAELDTLPFTPLGDLSNVASGEIVDQLFLYLEGGLRSPWTAT